MVKNHKLLYIVTFSLVKLKIVPSIIFHAYQHKVFNLLRESWHKINA